jgi:membrane associated rhomboid family serine protease
MLVPFNVDVPMSRIPLTNWVLIGVTSLISFILFLHYMSFRSRMEKEARSEFQEKWDSNAHAKDLEDASTKVRMGGDYVPFPWSLKRGAAFSVVQLFSYQLVHGGFLHLIGNMVFLFVFGNAVNAKLGHLLFLPSYFILGALAGLAWLGMGGGKELVGASGAIMGLVGIFFVFFPKNDVSVFYWINLARMGTFNVPGFVVVIFFMLSDLFSVALLGRSGGVAYVAHLIGLFFGFALAITLVWTRWIRSTKYEENLLQAVGIMKKRKRYEDDFWEQKKKRPRRLPQP